MLNGAVTLPMRIEATTLRISRQCARISATSMRPTIRVTPACSPKRRQKMLRAPAFAWRLRRKSDPIRIALAEQGRIGSRRGLRTRERHRCPLLATGVRQGLFASRLLRGASRLRTLVPRAAVGGGIGRMSTETATIGPGLIGATTPTRSDV